MLFLLIEMLPFKNLKKGAKNIQGEFSERSITFRCKHGSSASTDRTLARNCQEPYKFPQHSEIKQREFVSLHITIFTTKYNKLWDMPLSLNLLLLSMLISRFLHSWCVRCLRRSSHSSMSNSLTGQHLKTSTISS